MGKSDWVMPVRKVDKPWGHEEWFALVDGKYCGKTLHLRRGHSLSLQYHEHKEETIAVQSGRVLLEVGLHESEMDRFEMTPGESVHLPAGVRHRVSGIEDAVLLEASTPEVADVIRVADRYGRGGVI